MSVGISTRLSSIPQNPKWEANDPIIHYLKNLIWKNVFNEQHLVTERCIHAKSAGMVPGDLESAGRTEGPNVVCRRRLVVSSLRFCRFLILRPDTQTRFSMSRFRFLLLAACLTLGYAGGCSKEIVVVDTQDTAIASVARLYGEYLATHNNKPPRNEQSFREYLTQLSNEQRTAMGLSDLEKGLTSPRDGKPFKFQFGSAYGRIEYLDSTIVVYEQVGADGTVMAADSYGAVFTIPEAEAKQVLPID
jgi:hypothetical protein